MKNGEERGFTAAEFRTAQNEGWEKQYPYKVGKKKVYMTPSAAEAQGFVRADKHPKSTRYGRQNPISERWNSEEQLAVWRAAWADATNRHLERYGHDERNFGAYARKMLIDGYIIKVDYTEQKKLAAAVNRIASNINQICRCINSTGHFYEDDIAELKARLGDVWELLKMRQKEEL